MAKQLTWGSAENRTYHNGIDHGIFGVGDVFHINYGGMSGINLYQAFPWDGLISVTHDHEGGGLTYRYMYGSLSGAMEQPRVYTPKIETYLVPSLLQKYLSMTEYKNDGSGVFLDQPYLERSNSLNNFSMSYRNYVGDANKTNSDYELHFMYGLTGEIDSREDKTNKDAVEPEPVTINCVGVQNLVHELNTCHVSVLASAQNPTKLSSLETMMYNASAIPFPRDVLRILGHLE